VSKARRLFCQLSVGKMGYPGKKVARFPGVTTSAVVLYGLPRLKNSKRFKSTYKFIQKQPNYRTWTHTGAVRGQGRRDVFNG
jgi:hypothetical protein